MRIRLTSSVLVVVLACFATRARAQDVLPKVLTVEQQQEFDRWLKAETEWRRWIDKHRNVAERNWMGMIGRNWLGMSSDRKERPVPPAWLDEYCDSLTTSELNDSEPCRQYSELRVYDWIGDGLRQQMADARRDKPEHSVFNFKKHWGFGLGYDNQRIHGSAGMQMTIAEWGRWNYGTLGASLGFLRTAEIDQKTQQEKPKNDVSFFMTLASASYRIKYVNSLGMYWYVDFAQIYDMTHSVTGSQFGFSLSKK